MTDNAHNVQSSTVSPAAAATTAPAAPAMKSNDTSAKASAKAAEPTKVETTPKPAAKPEPTKVETSPAAPAAGGDAGTTSTTNDAASADASADGKRKDRLPRWVQERMERQKVTVERDTEARLRREFEQRYGQQQQAPQERQPANVGAQTGEQPKTLADFNFDHDAYTAHLVEREITRRENAKQQAEVQRQQAEAVEQFKTKIDAFESRVGDGSWDDIVNSPINTDPAFEQLTSLFMGSDNDLDIALYLANNLTEAQRINALPTPYQRALEVAKLVEQFAGATQATTTPPAQAAAAPEQQAAPPKKVTNAPPPPATVAGSGKAVPDVNSKEISTADRIRAWKNKGK